jgi:fatty-acyl-CoA synthase
MQHAAVRECCVVAKKDAAGLEKPLAIVVLKARDDASPALEADLIGFAKAKLARYKAPHWVKFVADPLPRNDRDKVDRKKLKAEHG